VIVGVGLDVVEVVQLERLLTRHGDRFTRRVFTDAERRECSGRADLAQALAARFAAKEACIKALRTGLTRGVWFRQIEVLRGRDGGPTLELSGRASEIAREHGVRQIHVSFAHQPGVAAATVILEA
jgi:holo-[acyl-carrier protein] synthase